MRKFLKEYFSFSPSEIRIIIILLGLILISFLIRFFIPSPGFHQFKLTAEDNMAIDSFINSLEKISYENNESYIPIEEKESLRIYRNFDPNLITAQEFDEMGFPAIVCKNLIRYRQAGGIFREKTDIKKIYGFSDSLYKEWADYIIIPKVEKKDTSTYITERFISRVINLNSADSVNLLEIGGIGPYFAGKIVNYRDRLGGYNDIRQLLEIKGMDTIRLESIKKHILIDSIALVKINLNKASSKELARHPYISRRFSEALLKYRQFSGPINDVDELLENRLISEAEYIKLQPYISVEE